MKYYDLVKMLKAYEFIPVKTYSNREVWSKNGKELTIPTCYDSISNILARRLTNSIKSF